MRLFHIATEEAHAALYLRGRLEGDARRADRAFLPAYGWMARQMMERIGPPPGRSKYPVWAWHTWNSPKAAPDLRCAGYFPRGMKGYLLTLDIPEEQVMLSDFDLWHYCLNNWYLGWTPGESEWAEHQAKSMTPAAWQALKEQSWHRIFDLSAPRDIEHLGALTSIQATFWRLEESMVVKARPFRAR